MNFQEYCKENGINITFENIGIWEASSRDSAKYELSVLRTVFSYLETPKGILTAKTILSKRISTLDSDFPGL